MARKTKDTTPDPLHGGKMHVPRSRGAVSGILLLILGAWGALIPFIGPWFSFGYTPDDSWHWTSARGWLEVLPGAVVIFGALLLLMSTNRITASAGGWLAVAGGAWFVVGGNFADLLHLGSVGVPRGNNKGLRLLESLTFFDGLGALILFLAAGAVGRLSVRSVRDVRAAQRREVGAEIEERRANAYQEQRRRELDKHDPDLSDERRNSDHDSSGDTTADAPAAGANGYAAAPNSGTRPNYAQPGPAPVQAPPNQAPPADGSTAYRPNDERR